MAQRRQRAHAWIGEPGHTCLEVIFLYRLFETFERIWRGGVVQGSLDVIVFDCLFESLIISRHCYRLHMYRVCNNSIICESADLMPT